MTDQIHNYALPVLVAVIFVFSYYIYVVEICFNISSTAKSTLYLVIYHLILLMCVWSFLKLFLLNVALVPDKFLVPPDIIEKISSNESNETKHRILLRYCETKQLTLVTRNKSGHVRFCNSCKKIKPDRAHHCSKCKICVLRMDHHCPWVNNCIGLRNHKTFILFLFYLSAYATFCFGTSLEFVLDGLAKQSSLYYLILTLVSLCFISGLIIILFFFFHISLLIKNRTTLESMSMPKFDDSYAGLSFNVGFCANIQQVFGRRFICYCCPVEMSPCDGILYPLSYPTENRETRI